MLAVVIPQNNPHGECFESSGRTRRKICWSWEVCKKHGISVVNFYNWQNILFEEGAALFERKPNASQQPSSGGRGCFVPQGDFAIWYENATSSIES